jgi:hypothetical protein
MTLLVGFLRSLFIHRETLILENLALRQQLATYKRTSKRPCLRMFDRRTPRKVDLRRPETYRGQGPRCQAEA